MSELTQESSSSKALVITAIIFSVILFGVSCVAAGMRWRAMQRRSFPMPPARPTGDIEAAAPFPVVNITVARQRVRLPPDMYMRPVTHLYRHPEGVGPTDDGRLGPHHGGARRPLRRLLPPQTTVLPTTIYEEIELARVPSTRSNAESVSTLPRYPSPPPSYRSGYTGRDCPSEETR